MVVRLGRQQLHTMRTIWLEVSDALQTKGDDAMRGAPRGMMNLIVDRVATMARWGDNVWDAAGKFW